MGRGKLIETRVLGPVPGNDLAEISQESVETERRVNKHNAIHSHDGIFLSQKSREF